jgi:hypothetical protein
LNCPRISHKIIDSVSLMNHVHKLFRNTNMNLVHSFDYQLHLPWWFTISKSWQYRTEGRTVKAHSLMLQSNFYSF